MHSSLLSLLRCPACYSASFQTGIHRLVEGRIEEGDARCLACGRVYPIREGILDALSPLGEAPRAAPSVWDQGGQWLMEQPWFSRFYDRALRPLLIGVGSSPSWLQQEKQFLAQAHLVGPDDLVLDAACGPGRFSRLLARHTPAKHVVGVDLSASMLRQHAAQTQAEGLSHRISLVRADVGRLPFMDRCFGATNCFTAFHLFPDMDRALDELARVTRPGRRLTVMVMVAATSRWRKPLVKVVSRLGHMRFPPAEEIKRMFWRHRIAMVEVQEGEMTLLLAGVVSESAQKSMQTGL